MSPEQCDLIKEVRPLAIISLNGQLVEWKFCCLRNINQVQTNVMMKRYPACGQVFVMTLFLTSVHKCKHLSEKPIKFYVSRSHQISSIH